MQISTILGFHLTHAIFVLLIATSHRFMLRNSCIPSHVCTSVMILLNFAQCTFNPFQRTYAYSTEENGDDSDDVANVNSGENSDVDPVKDLKEADSEENP